MLSSRHTPNASLGWRNKHQLKTAQLGFFLKSVHLIGIRLMFAMKDPSESGLVIWQQLRLGKLTFWMLRKQGPNFLWLSEFLRIEMIDHDRSFKSNSVWTAPRAIGRLVAICSQFRQVAMRTRPSPFAPSKPTAGGLPDIFEKFWTKQQLKAKHQQNNTCSKQFAKSKRIMLFWVYNWKNVFAYFANFPRSKPLTKPSLLIVLTWPLGRRKSRFGFHLSHSTKHWNCFANQSFPHRNRAWALVCLGGWFSEVQIVSPSIPQKKGLNNQLIFNGSPLFSKRFPQNLGSPTSLLDSSPSSSHPWSNQRFRDHFAILELFVLSDVFMGSFCMNDASSTACPWMRKRSGISKSQPYCSKKVSPIKPMLGPKTWQNSRSDTASWNQKWSNRQVAQSHPPRSSIAARGSGFDPTRPPKDWLVERAPSAHPVEDQMTFGSRPKASWDFETDGTLDLWNTLGGYFGRSKWSKQESKKNRKLISTWKQNPFSTTKHENPNWKRHETTGFKDFGTQIHKPRHWMGPGDGGQDGLLVGLRIRSL